MRTGATLRTTVTMPKPMQARVLMNEEPLMMRWPSSIAITVDCVGAAVSLRSTHDTRASKVQDCIPARQILGWLFTYKKLDGG
jgi:hypothetical protein